MTQEEALEILKAQNTDTMLHEAIITLHPELTESEDERMINWLITQLKTNYKSIYWANKAIAYLEKQKEPKPDDNPLDDPRFVEGFETGREVQKIFDEPKPAEWSEEDEDILNSCISSIEEAKENRYAYKETDGDTSYDREIAWLKSLRPQPHWKPSEEQIRALIAVAKNLLVEMPERHRLESLYNDLKKL